MIKLDMPKIAMASRLPKKSYLRRSSVSSAQSKERRDSVSSALTGALTGLADEYAFKYDDMDLYLDNLWNDHSSSESKTEERSSRFESNQEKNKKPKKTKKEKGEKQKKKRKKKKKSRKQCKKDDADDADDDDTSRTVSIDSQDSSPLHMRQKESKVSSKKKAPMLVQRFSKIILSPFSPSKKRSVRFDRKGEIGVIPFSPLSAEEKDQRFYSDEDMANFRHEAFLEKCGLDMDEWEKIA